MAVDEWSEVSFSISQGTYQLPKGPIIFAGQTEAKSTKLSSRASR